MATWSSLEAYAEAMADRVRKGVAALDVEKRELTNKELELSKKYSELERICPHTDTTTHPRLVAESTERTVCNICGAEL